METLRERGFVLQGQNLTGLLVNPRGFRANGKGTITRYVSSCKLAQAAQIELNAHLRVPERRSDASLKEHFQSRNPALIDRTIVAMTDLVQMLAEAV